MSTPVIDKSLKSKNLVWNLFKKKYFLQKFKGARRGIDEVDQVKLD